MDNIKVTKHPSDRIHHVIKYVIANKCFIKDGLLIECLMNALLVSPKAMYDDRHLFNIVTATDTSQKDRLVGVCFVYRDIVNTYVIRSHRRRGIGTVMFKFLVNNKKMRDSTTTHSGKQVGISKSFYQSVGKPIEKGN